MQTSAHAQSGHADQSLDEQSLANALKVGDVIVFTAPGLLRKEHREALHSRVSALFPADQVLIVDGGSTIERFSQLDQLSRIEAKQDLINGKLDALFDLLASEGEEEESPRYSLDGEVLSGERDATQAL